MKKTKTKTVTERDRYHLTKELKYDIHFKNGKEVGRNLQYTGKKCYGYELQPLYDFNLSLLKKENPCHGNSYEFRKNKNLPEPEDIDLNKITYLQFSTHMFYNFDKRPLSVVVHGDYIEACLDNERYDLDKLREHLLKRDDVISVSEVLDIPYYNCDDEDGRTKHIEVKVYPGSDVIDKFIEVSDDKTFVPMRELTFGKPWEDNGYDYLDIKKFLKPKNN